MQSLKKSERRTARKKIANERQAGEAVGKNAQRRRDAGWFVRPSNCSTGEWTVSTRFDENSKWAEIIWDMSLRSGFGFDVVDFMGAN